MTTHLFPVSAYPPVQQDPIPPESSDRWTLAVPLGIIAVTLLFMLYRMLSSEESSSPTASFDGKVVSKEAPIDPEKVLCIIRIFRTALEKTPGYYPIPAKVEIIAEKGGKLLASQEITLPKAEEFVDIASELPLDQKVWISIEANRTKIHKSLVVKSNPTLYQIKNADVKIVEAGETRLNPLKKPPFTLHENHSTTEDIPLPSFVEHPLITLKQEEQSLSNKKIVFKSDQMTLDPGYRGEPLMLENQSDRSIVVQIELKHGTNESFLLSYSVKPHRVTTCSPKLDRYVNKPPQPISLPLEQIIKDYQAAYTIKHRKELPSPQTEDFRILSIKYAHYQ